MDEDHATPIAAWATDGELVVSLADGRRIVTPLSWYPVLVAASPEERARIELSPFGVHWPDLDEDLSIEGMLRGEAASGDPPPLPVAAASSRH